MKPIIDIQQLGKKYRLQQAAPYLALRDTVTQSMKKIFTGNRSANKQDFWALQDINLEVEPGERIGIIGKNGAGKSTLLKILSRITPPTTGHAIMRGRFSSLLEVGTGFHNELTGRENIYLNGSILGLKKNEINRQFNAIVDFSGVQAFIDTPLKHYSSGMQLRLAFAVAVHLEPEILLIDEVLAVGDWEFQRRCLDKMEEISQQKGRTILFVSHNLAAITSFCRQVVVMEKGKIVHKGNATEMVQQYISLSGNTTPYVNTSQAPVKKQPLTIARVYTADTNGGGRDKFTVEHTVSVRIDIENNGWENEFTVGLALNDIYDRRVTISNHYISKSNSGHTLQCCVTIPAGLLTPNVYSVDVAIENPGIGQFDMVRHAVSFEIIKDGTMYERINYDYGVVQDTLKWDITNEQKI